MEFILITTYITIIIYIISYYKILNKFKNLLVIMKSIYDNFLCIETLKDETKINNLQKLSMKLIIDSGFILCVIFLIFFGLYLIDLLIFENIIKVFNNFYYILFISIYILIIYRITKFKK